MTLNFSFFQQRSDFTPNFNYIDILDSTGYISYDGVRDYAQSKYILFPSSNVFNGAITGNGKATSTGGVMDADFDLSPFKLPRTIEGDVLVSFNVGNGSGGVASSTCTITIKKWDGTSETDLATASTGSSSYQASENGNWAMALTVAKTKFNVGDVLRVTATQSNASFNFGHNPRDYGTGTEQPLNSTRFRVIVPYKLDFL